MALCVCVHAQEETTISIEVHTTPSEVVTADTGCGEVTSSATEAAE
jgi:hypothetical protein